MKKSVLKYLEDTITQDGWFLSALLILNSTVFLRIIIDNDISLLTIIWAIIFFINGFILIFVLCLLIHALSKFKYIKQILQILILIPWTLVFFIDAFLLFRLHSIFKPSYIEILMTTNFLTIKEFLYDYVFNFQVTSGIAIFLGGGVLFNHLIKKIFLKLILNISKNGKKILLFAAIFVIEPIILTIGEGISFYSMTNISQVFLQGLDIYEFIGNKSKIYEHIKIANEDIVSDKSTIPYVIFVLGESNDRNHMQIYDYNLPTTPLINERYDRNEILRFNDVIACGNHTTSVMQLLFNFAEKNGYEYSWTDNNTNSPVDEMHLWYDEPNIFNILKNCNYHIVWLSNQSPYGMFGSMDEFYSKCCDEIAFTEISDSFTGRKRDEVLLPVLDESLNKSSNLKNFYVIHLEGTHQAYSFRYPISFSKFTALDEDKPTEESRRVTAEYDNAMLYNDHILNEIIKRFEDKEAIVIYLSDHGNEVYEGREFAGHSDESEGNVHMIEVPMLVWASQSFKNNHSDKWNAMKKAVDRPYMTDDMIHSLLDLMDIKTASYDPRKSIWNDNFDSSRPRIYNGKPYVKN